jgi:hypothetical protein
MMSEIPLHGRSRVARATRSRYLGSKSGRMATFQELESM